MSTDPRILIVGTQPFNPNVQSRAFDSYFHQWKGALAQVFSDSRTPILWKYESLYQITDKRLLKARFRKKQDPGMIFTAANCADHSEWGDQKQGYKPPFRGPLINLLREKIWKKKVWSTPRFWEWVEAFKPQAVFISFSKDFFVFDIGLEIADRFNLPLILSIADDYVLIDTEKGKAFNKAYRKKYLALMSRILNERSVAIFESEKIRSAYTAAYPTLRGEIQYICTDMQPTAPRTIDRVQTIRYFGNLEFGRLNSIGEVADVLKELGSELVVEVYSADAEMIKKQFLKKHPNIKMHHQIPYQEALNIMKGTDVLLLPEGFGERNTDSIRYSLSTKVADTLALGNVALAYGPEGAGSIDFLSSEQCAIVAKNHEELRGAIEALLANPHQFDAVREKGTSVCKECFDIEKQSSHFHQLAEELISNHD